MDCLFSCSLVHNCVGLVVVAVVAQSRHDEVEDKDSDDSNNASDGPHPRIVAPGGVATHGVDGQPAGEAVRSAADVEAERLEAQHAETQHDGSDGGMHAVEGQLQHQEVEEDVAEQLNEEGFAGIEVGIANDNLSVVVGAVEDQTADARRRESTSHDGNDQGNGSGHAHVIGVLVLGDGDGIHRLNVLRRLAGDMLDVLLAV